MQGSLPPIPGGFTAVPNVLLDKVMPSLKDTEWRLLCVVLRQTYGRASRTGRKERDWISHAQLKSRTGRASEAISRAVDSLIRQGLVEVSSEAGSIVLSPAQRRRARHRLYYRITSRLQVLAVAHSTGDCPRICENRKAKTTTEIVTKSIPIGIAHQAENSHFPSRSNLHESLPAEPQQEVRLFLREYVSRFRACSMHGEPPPLSWGKDSRIVRDLLDLYGLPRLLELLQMFFESPEPWIRRSGYSMGAFRAAVGQLLIRGRSSSGYRGYRRDGYGRRTGGWQRAGQSPQS